MHSRFELTIRPRSGWQPIDFKEVYLQRELLGFLIWRDIKIRYRQTLLGGIWAIIQPLLAMVIFTFFFHRLAGVKGDPQVPYAVFAFAGLSAWTFFSNALSQASNSLVANQQLVKKVYFPRIFIPLGAIGALLMDLAFSLALLAVLMWYYHVPWTTSAFLLPLFIGGALLSSAGLGMILSALNVSFRDVKYVVPFMVQMGMFVTPVIYPIRYIPPKWTLLMGLNPMAGVVVGFRHSLLNSPASWSMMGLSLTVSFLLFVTGLFIFRRMERHFADVI
ncbi:MAG: ABC transporter permease [Acidobacteriaceae bacterium]